MTPRMPMELCGGFFLSNQAGVKSRAKSEVSGGFEPRFRGFIGFFLDVTKTNSCLELPYLQLLLATFFWNFFTPGLELVTPWSGALEKE